MAGHHSPLSPGRCTQQSRDSLTFVRLLWLTKQNSHLESQAFLQEDASHSYLLHEDRLSGSPKKKPVLCNGDLQEVSFSQVLPRKGCGISRPHGATCAPGEREGEAWSQLLWSFHQEDHSPACHSSPGSRSPYIHRRSRTARFCLCSRNCTVSAGKFLYSLKLLFLLERH